jgi:hypothetical protein
MATKKSAGRKPKGYVDDIWKALQAANKAGDKKRAQELRDIYDSATKNSMRQAQGKNEMFNQWGRILTKSLETDKRAKQATSKAAREAELARGRGIKSRAEALGARQQADPKGARKQAAERAQRRLEARGRGGVNSPKNVAKRRNKRSGGGRTAK